MRKSAFTSALTLTFVLLVPLIGMIPGILSGSATAGLTSTVFAADDGMPRSIHDMLPPNPGHTTSTGPIIDMTRQQIRNRVQDEIMKRRGLDPRTGKPKKTSSGDDQ